MKKITKTLVLLLFAAIFTAACSSAEPESFEQDLGVITSIDFDGYEFLQRGGYYPDLNQSTIGDAVLERYSAIEEECNIEITVEETVYANYAGDLMTHIAGGTKYADLMFSWIEHIFGAYRSGMVLPLTDNGFFDPEQEKYGTTLALDAVRFDSENVYGVQANVWPEKTSNIFNFVLFNHQIMADNALTSPYELLESGGWVWDKFREMAITCTNTAEDRWGITTEHDEFPLCAIFSNNGKLVKQDSTGKYIWGFNLPDAVEALEWCQTLVIDDKCLFQNDSSDAWETMWAFGEGRSAFHVGPSYFGLGTATGSEDDQMYPLVGLPATGFGWVPFPFGPKNPEQTWNIEYDHMESYYNIPADMNIDTDIVFQVIDRLFEPIEGVPDWQDYYGRYLFTETTGFETYLEMLDRASVSYLHILGDSRGTMVNSLAQIMRQKRSITQDMEALATAMQAVVDDVYGQ